MQPQVTTHAAVVGCRVHLYRNLHAEREAAGYVYSVRMAATGRVVATAPYVLLRDVTLHVQPAGRGRVIAEGRKNVHAYLSGIVVATGASETRTVACPTRITYNPYTMASFQAADEGHAVHAAKFAVATPRGVWVLEEEYTGN